MWTSTENIAEYLWEETNIAKRFDCTYDELLKIMKDNEMKYHGKFYYMYQKSQYSKLYKLLKELGLKTKEQDFEDKTGIPYNELTAEEQQQINL